MCNVAQQAWLAIVIGVAATVVMDVWGAVQKQCLGITPLPYGMVGRWLGHLARGRWRHDAITAAPPIRGERLLGWTAHYVTGVAFAAVLLLVWGPRWAAEPTIAPAMMVGIGSVVFPFLLMQPGMGAGVAASRTPRPAIARVRSVATHAVFGLGLYGAGEAARLLGLTARAC